MAMTRTQTIVQLTEDLVAGLDARAQREGVSRSAVIRAAVEQLLAEDREADLDRQIVEGYQRSPQGGVFDRDEWGDLGAFVSGLAMAQWRELESEEREADVDPW